MMRLCPQMVQAAMDVLHASVTRSWLPLLILDRAELAEGFYSVLPYLEQNSGPQLTAAATVLHLCTEEEVLCKEGEEQRVKGQAKLTGALTLSCLERAKQFPLVGIVIKILKEAVLVSSTIYYNREANTSVNASVLIELAASKQCTVLTCSTLHFCIVTCEAAFNCICVLAGRACIPSRCMPISNPWRGMWIMNSIDSCQLAVQPSGCMGCLIFCLLGLTLHLAIHPAVQVCKLLFDRLHAMLQCTVVGAMHHLVECIVKTLHGPPCVCCDVQMGTHVMTVAHYV